MIQIERASQENIVGILKVEKVTWLAVYPNEEAGITVEDVAARFNSKFEQDRIKEIETEMSSKDFSYYVAKADSRVIGYLRLFKGPEFNDLIEIYVLPNYHGMGIGRSLMKTAFRVFNNKLPIRLEVAIYNDQAIGLYKHYGFKVRPDLKQEPDEMWNVLPSGKLIPVIFMENSNQEKTF
jgi:ribosomal protein S18 acetylase RimI-like enzyme